MIALCLALASAGPPAARIDAAAFTLRWEHSVERVRWEEHYVVERDGLRLVEASVAGSGAGMEPPPDARLEHGMWVYRPDRLLPELRLTRSTFTTGYELCIDDASCVPLAAWLGPVREEGETVRIAPCAS